jgi:thioesterase domain-containing protein
LAGRSKEIPLLCVPGAGGNVTAFLEFVSALSDRCPVYGLQPRGIDPEEPPHETVREAALYNLSALTDLLMEGPVHLLGHSHGGLVAFEMARCLRDRGGHLVASLSLIDTEPPRAVGGVPSDLSTAAIYGEFVGVLELIYAKSFDVSAEITQSEQTAKFVAELHNVLVREKCLPSRSSPRLLLGPLATFTAARRSTYTPAARYPSSVHLALVRDPGLNDFEDRKHRDRIVTEWRKYAENLAVWFGPGNHFSILQVPQCRSLAEWWQRSIAS